jgi:large subunit ribosomal protein L18
MARKTLVAVSDHELEKSKTKTEAAKLLGTSLAKKAKIKKIVKITFDRSYYRYHGRVKQLADAARDAGLEF